MLRRTLIPYLLMTALAFAVFFATRDNRKPGQPDDGVYYFNDIGVPTDQLVINIEGYEALNGINTLAKTRALEPHEFEFVETPEGIIGVDIHYDKTIDETVYARTDFTLDTPAGIEGNDGRVYSVAANSYQFVPKMLYLYAVQTKGLPDQAIDYFSSNTDDLIRNNAYDSIFMQSTNLRNDIGLSDWMDDSDTFYFIGGEILDFNLFHWDQDTYDRYMHGYTLHEHDLSKLGVGKSVKVELLAQPLGKVRDITATITKVALLRNCTE